MFGGLGEEMKDMAQTERQIFKFIHLSSNVTEPIIIAFEGQTAKYIRESHLRDKIKQELQKNLETYL